MNSNERAQALIGPSVPPSRKGWSEWALSRVGIESGPEAEAKVRAFQLSFLFWMSANLLHHNLIRWGQLSPTDSRHVYYMLGGSIVGGATILAISSRRFVRAPWLAALGVALWHVALTFPFIANHNYLVLWILLLAGFLNLRLEEDRRLFVSGVKWMAILVFLYAGLQKMVHGYYFDGQALATYINRIEWFRDAFGHVLPEAELARIADYARLPGQGPFRLYGLVPTTLSNLVYIAELACAGLLLAPRTRVVGVAASLGLLVGIEVFAREVFFGSLQMTVVLLFAPTAWSRRAVPVFAASYVLLLLSAAGVLPAVTLH